MIVAALLGLLTGILAGFIPAVGTLTALVLVMPFLINFSAYELLLFYMVMVTATQYITAIPSILLAIPGHPSSVHTVKESAGLSNSDKFNLLKITAIYSFISTTIVVTILYIFLGFIEKYIATFFRSEIIFSMLVLTFILGVAFSSNKIIVSALLLILGSGLSFTGYNLFFDTNVTFGFNFLSGGFDSVIVVVMLFGVQEIFKNYQRLPSNERRANIITKSNSIVNSVFSTIVGFIGGLVPGLTTVASSSIYYYLAKSFKLRSSQLIVGVESANAVGSISQILPVIYFGIPILASEALLLSLMQSKGFIISNFSVVDFFESSFWFFVVANILATSVCLVFASRPLVKINLELIQKLALTMLTVSIGFYVLTDNTEIKILQVLILLPMSILLRKTDNIPLIIGFLISPMLFESAARIF